MNLIFFTRFSANNHEKEFGRIAKSNYFLMYKQEIEFVKDFSNKYNKLPDLQTALQKFPALQDINSPEPLEYYAEKVQEQFLYDAMINANDEIVKSLEARDIKKTAKLFKEFSEKMGVATYYSKDVNLAETMQERLDKYHSLRNGLMLKGIPSGWKRLDIRTGGFMNTDFVVFFGKAKTMKTYLLIALALQAWQKGFDVLFYSREMGHEQITRRTDAMLGGVSALDLKTRPIK